MGRSIRVTVPSHWPGKVMLACRAEHRITADVEVIAPDAIDAANVRLARSDVEYRFVVDMRA